jgi:SnoaL-like domain
MFRDIGQWDKLRTLFHPDGRMEASWFQGLFSDFVDASMRMGASDLRTKHVMGTPIISLTNDKAIAETNGFNLLKPRITPYHIVEKAVLCTTAFWPARLPQWVKSCCYRSAKAMAGSPQSADIRVGAVG